MGIDQWIVKNAGMLRTVIRVLFGFAWLLAGIYKFQPGMSDTFISVVNDSIGMSPPILVPWASLWAGQVAANPGFYVSMIGILELSIGLAVIFGFMRKIAYVGGALLMIVIWSVGEGYGGVFMPGATDIGGAVMYAYISALFLLMQAEFGTSRYSLDYYIEKRLKWWKKLAEVKY